MRMGLLLAIALIAVLSGCLGRGPVAHPSIGNVGQEPWTSPPWPDVKDAVLRPGSITNPAGFTNAIPSAMGGGCTLDFVFRSPDNRTLYMGTAAHCVGEGNRLDLWGDTSQNGPVAQAKVVYNSFLAMNTTTDAYVAACQNQNAVSDTPACWNDFALLEIPAEARHLVHPSVHFFGGPTGLALPPAVGDRVQTFGRAGARAYRAAAGEPADAAQGVVTRSGHWFTLALMTRPEAQAGQGDSGGPALTADGKALGLTNWAYVVPSTDGETVLTTGILNLQAALDFAEEHGAPTIQLCMWGSTPPLDATAHQ